MKENNFFSQLFLFLRELKNKIIFNLFIFLHNFYRGYIPPSGRRAKPKAPLPRYSREDGKTLNEVHPQKANLHMRETEGGKITSFEFLHSKNASFPIYFIDVGISIFELSSLQFVNLNISS